MPNCCECKIETKIDRSELVFKPITLDAKSLIDSYTNPWMLECSDLSFTNLFIWIGNGFQKKAHC